MTMTFSCPDCGNELESKESLPIGEHLLCKCGSVFSVEHDYYGSDYDLGFALEKVEVKSRAYTAEEVREKFLDHIRKLVDYWDKVQGRATTHERLSGLAFGILNIFDGGNLDLPAFDIIPSPHLDDKLYHIVNQENWFEPEVINDCQLHELFYKKV